jgi:CHAD domain-containing protein
MRTADAANGAEQDTAVHDVRKAAKRLRYEVATSVIGRPAQQLQQRLRPLQDLFGDDQDTVVARPVLLDIAIAAHAAARTPSPSACSTPDRPRAPQLRTMMESGWAHADREKIRSWLP